MGGPTSAGEALDEDLARAASPALSSARRRLERRRPRESERERIREERETPVFFFFFAPLRTGPTSTAQSKEQ